MEIERRTIDFEWRIDAGADQPVIRGYGAVFNSESQDLGGFTEKIAPGAFARSVRGNPDIVALFNHEPSMLLGRTGAGTLTVREDKNGLYMEVTPPEHRMDVVNSIKRGDVPGMSFQFTTIADSWEGLDTEHPVRTLEEVRLMEVGPVVFPAYQATQVSARALETVGGNHSDSTSGPEPSDEPSGPPQVETPGHSEADAGPQEQHSAPQKSLAQINRELREEYEAMRMVKTK